MVELEVDMQGEEFSGWEQRGVELPGGSAESIALSLLSRVGTGRLPPADQLTWLVSRDEVDQDLLPLPSSLPVDPEFSSDFQDATELRGTLTWLLLDLRSFLQFRKSQRR